MPTGLGDEKLWLCPSLDDAAAGTLALNDLTGLNAAYTLTGGMTSANWVTDTDIGGVRAIEFDNTTKRITGSLATLIADVGTITMWVKVSAAQNGIPFQMIGSSTGYILIYLFSGPTIGWYWETSGGGNTSTVPYRTGRWMFLSMSYTGGAYISRFFDRTLTAKSALTGASRSVILSPTADPFAGYFDDLRIFDRDLSETELSLLASKRGYTSAAASGGVRQVNIRGGADQ
jgi:hypothetical protein